MIPASLYSLGYGLLALLTPFIVLGLVAFIMYRVYRGTANVGVTFDAGTVMAAFLVSGSLMLLALAVFSLAYAINPHAFNQTSIPPLP